MLVYDITNEKSFDNIRNWIRNIEEVSPKSNFFCCSFFKCLHRMYVFILAKYLLLKASQ